MKKLLFTISAVAMLMTSCNKPSATNSSNDGVKDVLSDVKVEQVSDEICSPQDGGEGFEKFAAELGFKTNVGKDYGNPHAVKGGTFHSFLVNFPGVLRPHGPNANTTDVGAVVNPLYQANASIMNFNTETNQWERGIADFWKFSEDGKTLWIRLNPAVKFSNGEQLTTDDIIATWELITSEGVGNPIIADMFKKFTLTRESKFILKVEASVFEWKMWMDFTSSYNFAIMPHSFLDKVDAKTYTEKYAMDVMPGLGPYTLDKTASKDQELIVLKRNPNWWGDVYPENRHVFNFDEIQYKIIREERVIQEAFKRGEIDRFITRSTDWWFTDEFMKSKTTFSPLKRNLIVKKVLFDDMPKRKHYIVFNTRVKPFSDIRVREAISLAFNKDLVIEKLLHNDAIKTFSIMPLSQWASPNLEQFQFDPQKAGALLDEAGFNIIDADGVRKNAKGERLELDVSLFKEISNEEIHNVLQSNLQDIGIKLNLQVTDFPTIIKKLNGFDFNMIKISLGLDTFPAFENEFSSKSADQLNSFNTPGFKDKRADEIIEAFLVEQDAKKRFALAHELDEIVSKAHTFMQLWAFPYSAKFMMWNKFGLAGDFTSSDPVKFWFVDKEKEALLEKAKLDETITMDEGEIILDAFKLKPSTFQITEY